MIVDIGIFLIFPPVSKSKILGNLLLFPSIIVVIIPADFKVWLISQKECEIIYRSIRKIETGNVGYIMFYKDGSAGLVT